MDFSTLKAAAGWFKDGWYIFLKNMPMLIIFSIILSFCLFLFIWMGLSSGGTFIAFIFYFLLLSILITSWCFLSLRAVRGEELKVSYLFSGFSDFWRICITFAIFNIMIGIGYTLFILPGIFLTLKFGASLFASMDKRFSPIETFQFSNKITKGNMVALLWAFIIGYLLVGFSAGFFILGLRDLGTQYGDNLIVIGIIPYIIFVLVVFPFVGTSFAVAYESLLTKSNGGVE